MSKVIIHKRAAKYMKKLPKIQKELIKNSLRQLEINPLKSSGIRHMAGQWSGYYRLRVGNWRIIYWYEETEDIVYIDHIGPRGDVYK